MGLSRIHFTFTAASAAVREEYSFATVTFGEVRIRRLRIGRSWFPSRIAQGIISVAGPS